MISNLQNVYHQNILKKDYMSDIVTVKVKNKSDKLKGKVYWKCIFLNEVKWENEKTNILKIKCFKCSEIYEWKKQKGLTYCKWKW